MAPTAPSEFPLTREDVLAAREAAGFVTPLEPFEPGDRPWFIWESRGSYEFLVHPTDAAWYLEHGLVFNGEHLPVNKIEEWPMIGAWHLHAVDPEANKQFIPSVHQPPVAAKGLAADRELAVSA